MNMRDVLSYPLGPLPWSLASPQGTLIKTDKAKLLHILEDEVAPLENVPVGAWIIDAMAMLQSFQGRPSTFAELASLLLQCVLSQEHTHGGRVDLVFD